MTAPSIQLPPRPDDVQHPYHDADHVHGEPDRDDDGDGHGFVRRFA